MSLKILGIALILFSLNVESADVEIGKIKSNMGNTLVAKYEDERFIRIYLGRSWFFERYSSDITTQPYLCINKENDRPAIFFAEKGHKSDRESYYAITRNNIGTWRSHWLGAQAEEFEQASDNAEPLNDSLNNAFSNNCALAEELEVALYRENMIGDLVYKVNADKGQNDPMLLKINEEELFKKISAWQAIDEYVSVTKRHFKKLTLMNVVVSTDIDKVINLVYLTYSNKVWLIHYGSGQYPDFDTATLPIGSELVTEETLEITIGNDTLIDVSLKDASPVIRKIKTTYLGRLQ